MSCSFLYCPCSGPVTVFCPISRISSWRYLLRILGPTNRSHCANVHALFRSLNEFGNVCHDLMTSDLLTQHHLTDKLIANNGFFVASLSIIHCTAVVVGGSLRSMSRPKREHYQHYTRLRHTPSCPVGLLQTLRSHHRRNDSSQSGHK